jgi:hypothetical protein
MSTDPHVIDAATDDEPEPTTALARRTDLVPVTLNDLAALRDTALENITTRGDIMVMLRKVALRMTSPEDHLLFRAPSGQITSYLGDAGAGRVRDVFGVEIYNVSRAEKILGSEPGSFMYLVTGDARCKLTGQTIESIEGARSSADDFCRGKSGIELDVAVRRAARANLNGGAVRELCGFKSVPLRDLEEAWAGTKKSVNDCSHGRGFGTRDERVGGRSAKGPDVDPPICPHCKATAVYRPARDGRKPFYGCPNYESHRDKKFTIDVDAWMAKQQPAKPTPPATDAAAAATPPAWREPGQEG